MTLRRHDDVVRLDLNASGNHIITRLITLERFVVGDGADYELVFDSEGCGAVCGEQAEPQLL